MNMDMGTDVVQKVTSWVQDNVGDRISKQELVQKSQQSDLPMEAKSAMQGLPEGDHTKESILKNLREQMMSGDRGVVGAHFGGTG